MLTLTKVFDYNYKALKDGFRYIVNQGGTSSSKTYSILQLLTAIALKHKNHIDIVGITVPHLKDGILKDMSTVFEQFGLNWHLMYNKADKYVEFNNGSKLQFIAFDNIGKAHGGRRDILYLNEANHQNYNIVEQLMARTRKTIFIDYNPTNAFWVHNKLMVDEPEQVKLIRSTYKDNQFLEQSIIDFIESRRGDGNNNFWRVYGLGELGVAEGLVFDNFEELDFDRSIFDTYYNGIDWGFSNDPFAFVRVARHNNCLYVCNEIYGKGLLNKDSAPMVKAIINNEYVNCDCAEPKSVEEYKYLGVNALGPAKVEIETGIKHLQSYDKIYIHPSCHNTLSEFRNYEWKQDKNGDYLPTPVDAFNHAIDAIRYALRDVIGYNTISVIKGLRL